MGKYEYKYVKKSFRDANGVRHFFVSYCHNVLHLSDAQIQTITGHKTSVVLRNNYLHSMNDDQTGQLVSDKLAKFM